MKTTKIGQRAIFFALGFATSGWLSYLIVYNVLNSAFPLQN